MRRLAATAVAALLVLVPVGAAEDFTGKWSGAFNITEPEVNDDVIALELKHKGTELTGTAGPNADQQWPLTGKVDGNKLTFDVQHPAGMAVKFALTFAEGRLKGTAAAEQDGRKFAAKVDVGRAK